MEKSGLALPVRKLDLRFRSPAHYEDTLQVRVSVDRITAASVRFVYEISRPSDETQIATGTTELACIDLTSTPRKPHVLPKAMHELFS
jgi:acyl-CoA thioester hydrolase